MTTPTDPANWPDAPPPLPPTLPAGPPPTAPVGPPVVPPSFAAPGPAGAPPPGPPSATRTGLVAAIVAVVVVLALAAGTFVAVRRTSDESATAPSTTTTEAPTTTERTGRPSTTDPAASDPGAAAPGDIQAEVEEISAFVEEQRGLTFDEPVPVEALPADEFKARVLQEFETEQDTLETQGALLIAGGIVPPDTDIVQSQLDLLSDGVLGFYDPITKELVVRSDSDGPMVRSVIAHELTHALDDQHFDLDRPELADRHDGSDWAFLALVEGSAKRVENAYLAQLSPEDQDQLASDQMTLALDQMQTVFSTPLVLAQILMAPYDYGAPFVDTLVDAGGRDRLDAAFGDPPTSSEQVLDSTRYAGDQPMSVATPPAEGEVIDDGVLGQLFTGFLLAESTELDDLLGGIDPAQLEDVLGNIDLQDLQDMLDQLDGALTTPDGSDPSDTTAPGDLGGLDGLGDLGQLGGLGNGTSAGGFPPVATTPDWGGDHYVVWKADGQVCLRVDWVMDTPEALTTFRGDVQAWAARDASVTVSDPTPDVVRATRCAAQPANP